jgi:DNA-binding transcriptional ArsR family regulator
MSLPAVSQHIGALERCGLISRGRHRQTRPCRLEPEALEAAVSWIEESRRVWAERMDRVEGHLATNWSIGGSSAPHARWCGVA